VARWAVLTFVLLTVAGCGGSSPEPADKTARATAVERALDAELRAKVEDTGVPGAVASVVFADGSQWSGAAGDAVLEPQRSMTVDTSVPFDSITKVATATLALRLAEQDRLRLDDPVAEWYPGWRGADDATVRDLLGHTSGLRDPPESFWTDVLAHPRRLVSRREFLAASRPGPRTTSAEYSNAGFVVAGVILERAAGAPLAEAMRREAFAHPGGDGLALQPAERPAPPLAHAYWYPRSVSEPVDVSDGGPLIPSRVWANLAGSAGALAGSVPSLARWGHELLGGRILEPESLREMTDFHDGAFWLGYGLGLARDHHEGRELWGHGGEGIGTYFEFWHLPEDDLTIAVHWNDDAIDRNGQILPALLNAALG
jgi:D-alanyl-D-alanine carboxypeptidase